jgi:hypothetical protein
MTNLHPLFFANCHDLLRGRNVVSRMIFNFSEFVGRLKSPGQVVL